MLCSFRHLSLAESVNKLIDLFGAQVWSRHARSIGESAWVGQKFLQSSGRPYSVLVSERLAVAIGIGANFSTQEVGQRRCRITGLRGAQVVAEHAVGHESFVHALWQSSVRGKALPIE